jgi:hypothetical protein
MADHGVVPADFGDRSNGFPAFEDGSNGLTATNLPRDAMEAERSFVGTFLLTDAKA